LPASGDLAEPLACLLACRRTRSREAAASYLYLYLYLGRHSAFGCVRVRSVSVSVRSDAFGVVLGLAHGRAQSPHYRH